MLIDKYMPQFDFNEIHSIKIDAATETVMRGVKELETREIHSIMNILFQIRSIPNMLKGRNAKSLRTTTTMLDEMYKNKFFLLEENKNELVIGLIGKFWQLTNSEEITINSPKEFFEFDNPEFGIVVCNMLFSGGKLITETRICVHDKSARAKFRRYWIAIRLGSGLIRRVWLKAIKRKTIEINNMKGENHYAKNIL